MDIYCEVQGEVTVKIFRYQHCTDLAGLGDGGSLRRPVLQGLQAELIVLADPLLGVAALLAGHLPALAPGHRGLHHRALVLPHLRSSNINKNLLDGVNCKIDFTLLKLEVALALEAKKIKKKYFLLFNKFKKKINF